MTGNIYVCLTDSNNVTKSSPPEISVTFTDVDTDDRQRYALLLPWLVVLIANHLVRIAQYDFLREKITWQTT